MTIAIIGAGAAGLMAAATILEADSAAKVIVLEKNAVLGRKVEISGGGRCNVTTGIHDIKELLTRYQRGRKFLTTALYHFPPTEVYRWFEQHDVPLKIEEDLRVFPQSDKGHDIIAVFERLFSRHQVDVRLRTSVKNVVHAGNQFQLTLQSGATITVDRVILTTGGQAYRHTGSTGDGYHFAESLGHHITALAPSLNAFIAADAWAKQLAGVSFAAVGLSISEQKQWQATGPIVFTHQGISGPAVFALSSQVAFIHYDTKQPLPVLLDFLPAVSAEQLRQALDQIIAANPKQQVNTTLHTWLPKSVVAAVLTTLPLPADKPNAELSKAIRQQLVDRLKRCPLPVIGRAAGDEFVTAGGIELNEVNPRTMESKLCPGVYFAGEILNIDGYTGGFNLQAAWATGRLAGLHINP